MSAASSPPSGELEELGRIPQTGQSGCASKSNSALGLPPFGKVQR